MENKQIIHIALEIIALIGLTFYFNQKNKKLLSHIENLAQKIEEQEDLLQKHEQAIKKMLEFINQSNQNNAIATLSLLEKQVEPSKIHKKLNVNKKEVHTKPPLIVPTPPKTEKTRVSFNDEIIKTNKSPQLIIESEESEDAQSEESDLDAELAEELEELEIEEEINIADLKKKA